MRAPARFVDWVNQRVGFNPRAGTYSDALSEFVVADLRSSSAIIRERLDSGLLVSEINADVATPALESNLDLVIWGREGSSMDRKIYLSVENKLLLTAHGKARKNRLRDIVAFSNHVHNANRFAVAGGLIGINLSPDYENPDPFAAGMTRHRVKMEKVVADTVEIYTQLPRRETADEPRDMPEAFGVFVIWYDGRSSASLVTESPAPTPGHPLHYETFIRRIVGHYERRLQEK